MKFGRLLTPYLFLVIFFAPLVPVFYLGTDHHQRLSEQKLFLEREMRGVEQITLLFQVLKESEQPPQSISQRKSQLEKVEALKRELLFDLIYGDQIFRHPQIDSIRKLDFIRGRSENFSDFRNTVNAIADLSGLILDSNLSSYSLVEALVIRYTDLVRINENLTHHHEIPSNINPGSTFKVFAETFNELRYSVQKSIIFDSTQSKERELFFEIISELHSFRNEPQKMIALFEEKERVLAEAGFSILKKQLQARIDKIEYEWQRAMVSTLLLAILSFLFSMAIFFYLRHKQTKIQNELREKQESLEKGYRLATVGEVFASIAHDIANPIQIIKLSVGQSKKQLNRLQNSVITESDNHKILELLNKIEKMTEKSEAIIYNMRSLLVDNPGVKSERFTVHQIISDLKDLTEYKLRKEKVHLEFKSEYSGTLINGNLFAVIQILTNLVNNAIDALKESIEKDILVKIWDDEKQIYFSVQDSGPGISPDAKEKIFSSLYTTKQNSGGTGLGLAISQKMARKLNGSLCIVDSNKGACFLLVISKQHPSAPELGLPLDLPRHK